jgi:hypothetical protein
MPAVSVTQVLAATRRWLKPAVHILLRCGITWREFSELAKGTFVEIASTQFGRRGRPTNVSRTAMLTGLTRRDVRRERNRLQSGAPSTPYVSKAAKILARWHLERMFQDAKRRPARLPLEGDGATFATLLRQCGAGDLRPSTVLKELLRAGAVRQHGDGRIEALQRNFIPQPTDEQLIRLWGTVLADVATVYVHNMTRTGKAAPRFERAAKSDRIPVTAAPAFRKFLEREGQEFLERVDAWLAAHEVREGNARENVTTTRMGAGVYHIDDGPKPEGG